MAEYEECERFISDHPDILREPHGPFVETAVDAIRSGRNGDAQRCIQQLLILRRCQEIGRRRFFDRLTAKDNITMTDFINDFKKIWNTLKESASTAPANTGPVSLPPRSSSLESAPFQNRRHDAPATSGFVEDLNRMSFTDRPQIGRHEEHSRLADIPEGPGIAPVAQMRPVQTPGPRSRHDSSNTEAPRRNSTRGNQTQAAESRYTIHHSDFFVVGRVFALRWHEGHTSGATQAPGPRDTRASDWSRYGQAYTTTRRMVVVHTKRGRCWCAPVTTYSGVGLKKRGLSQSDRDSHAIIYMAGTQPQYLNGEPRSTKSPIEVNAAHQDKKLDVASRVNFSAVHTVE